MRTHHFRTAVVTVEDGVITARFTEDGSVNVLDTNWLDTEEYRGFARLFGYGEDWRRYSLEHELTHHWLADRMGWRYSYSLRENPTMPWPAHVAWEEHLANAIQSLARTGQPDPYNVPQLIWRDQLPEVVADWRRVVETMSREHDD